MSKATIQAYCLMSACKSGLVTSANAYPDLSENFKDMIIESHNMISDAIRKWTTHKHKDSRTDELLAKWHTRMNDEGYGDENNLTVMVALSVQALEELEDKVRDPAKKKLLLPAIEILDEMNGLLHVGCKSRIIEAKIETAEKLLFMLFDACGFEPEQR